MAKGNMILTLVAQSKGWAQGLKRAAKDTITFGSIVKSTMKAVSAAFLGIAGSIVLFLPNFIKMGEEARKSERRLANIATNMGLFGDNTVKVTKRLSDYATTLSFATGVDDELIRANEAVLLTFKELAKTADTVGGPFDRATQALLDLEAAGKDVTAVKLGKALADPVGSLKALGRAGIVFNKTEMDTIKKLVEHNNLLAAQDVILSKIEGQVGGTAAATASATDKMGARFEDMAETLSGALLPSVDILATKMGEWLDSVEGKKAISDLTKQFENFGKWLTSAEGMTALKDFGTVMSATADAINATAKAIVWLSNVLKGIDYGKLDAAGQNAYNLMNNKSTGSGWSGPTSNVGATVPKSAKAPIVVNVKGITPAATTGKTVLDAIKNAQRLGMR